MDLTMLARMPVMGSTTSSVSAWGAGAAAGGRVTGADRAGADAGVGAAGVAAGREAAGAAAARPPLGLFST